MSWSEAVDKAPGLGATVSQPVAGLRARPDPRSELVSQEIFGRPIHVVEARGDWCLCVAADSTRGWVPVSYLSLSADYKPKHEVATRFAPVAMRARSDLVVPMGGLIEVTGKEGKRWRVRTPDGISGRMDSSSLRSRGAVRLGRASASAVIKQVTGVPYLWGGKSTFGFDCSGLVQFLYGLFGIRLPRDSRDQARHGRKIGGLAYARPFDLLFFGERRAIDHVAVHLGGLDILHASGRVRIESLDATSTVFRADLLARFALARRITS